MMRGFRRREEAKGNLPFLLVSSALLKDRDYLKKPLSSRALSMAEKANCMTDSTSVQTYCKIPMHTHPLRAEVQAEFGFLNRFPILAIGSQPIRHYSNTVLLQLVGSG